MTNQEVYTRLVQKFFEDFRINEYNKKVSGLNAAFDKPENLNIVSVSTSGNGSIVPKDVKKGPKTATFKGHGAVKGIVKNYVKTLPNDSKFNILEILPELRKVDPNILQQSVAGVLKKWAIVSKGKNADLSEDGILIYKQGKGTKPTIYKKRDAVL
jgi:hypothetical protein